MARATRDLLIKARDHLRGTGEEHGEHEPRVVIPTLMLVKLDDHLPAPTDDFEADPFTPTTVTAKRTRKVGTGNSRDTHYTLDPTEKEGALGPITVVNRFPWVWEYQDAYLWVENFNGEWVPRQPHFSIVLGKAGETIAKEDSGIVNVYWDLNGTGKGTEAFTGETITTVYNRYVEATSGAWVTVQWHNDGWELRTLECFE